MTNFTAIATAANVSPEYAEAWAQSYAQTAVKLIEAGEMTFDNLNHELIHEAMQVRLERLFAENFDAIAEEVWERVNAA